MVFLRVWPKFQNGKDVENGGIKYNGEWDHYVSIIWKFIVTVKFALNCQKVNRPMSGTFLINLINRLLVWLLHF